MTEDEQKRQEETEMTVVKKAAADLGEHFESVQIFVSKLADDGLDTVNINYGTGNWFARYGQTAEWLTRVNEDTRISRRKRDEN